MLFFGRVGVYFIYPLNPDLSDNKSHTKKHWAERGGVFCPVLGIMRITIARG